MNPGELILIIGAISAPILAIWNSFQGMRIKELELKYANLCKDCVYDFTPRTSKTLAKAS